MDDSQTISMPDDASRLRLAARDCVTLLKDDGAAGHDSGRGWRPLGDVRVSDGLRGLLGHAPTIGGTQESAASDHRYLIGRELGRGGMGVVFEGWDAQLQRSVAIKVLDHPERQRPGAVAWFFREARIASRLQHPGIVAIHEFDLSAAGQAFIVMQLLSGITLKERLAARADPDADLPGLLVVFLQICQAVACAHEHGVIHRDLKPSNIMVGRHGVVTVMDWGLAKVLALPEDPLPDAETTEPFAGGSGETRSHLTASGTVFGTPAYLAPEQARGEIARVDTRADVFGLGGILCEILTGRPPFVGRNPTATWAMAVDADITAALERLDACGGPAAVVRLAKRCLAAAPEARPATATELVTELTGYLESGQRRAEQELVRFFDLSADLFYTAGFDGVLRRFNENLPRRLGHAAAELKGRSLVDFVHPDDRGETQRVFERLRCGEATLEFTSRCRHADGRYLWLEWNARAVPEESAIYAVGRDVSERSALAAFTAASGLYLVSTRGLRERLGDVAEEAITHLDIAALQVWGWSEKTAALELLAASGPDLFAPGADSAGPAVERLAATVARDRHPRQIAADEPAWLEVAPPTMERLGIRAFAGYPLMVADRIVGVLAVYAPAAVSEPLVTALSSVIAGMALAIEDADRSTTAPRG